MKQELAAKFLVPGDTVFRFGVTPGRVVNSVIDMGNSVKVEYFGKTSQYDYEHQLTVERKQ